MKYRIRLDDGSEAIVDGKTARKAVEDLLKSINKTSEHIYTVQRMPGGVMINERQWK